MSDNSQIVPLHQPEATTESIEARARSLRLEVERLARLPTTEWLFYLESEDYPTRFGISIATMREMVEAVIKETEKKSREDTQHKRHVEKEQVATKKDEERKQDKATRDAERKEEKEARELARKQEKESKDAARKEKDKTKAFKEITRLPTKEQDAQLTKLAKLLDEELETIRAEFVIYTGEQREIERTEPWPTPVPTKDLLTVLEARVRRHIVLDDEVAMAISLWTMFSWVHETAVHSPLLIVTSAERDSGKTTLLGVLGFLTPRPYLTVELTGPGLFHVVDHLHPSLIVDEADKLFERKNDLLHIVNAGWTKGSTITRIVKGLPREFDPFCAKVIGMKGGLSLPDTLASRGIIAKLWPMTEAEKGIITNFSFSDDEEFETLRRKCMRWSADNSKLQAMEPAMPLGFVNRLAANWKVLFAIAELAGCLERAHLAAVALSTKMRRPSEGVRLLAALRPIFENSKALPSADIVQQLVADQDGEWCEYRGSGPITKRQLALLLDAYDVHPTVIHTVKGATSSARGYRAEQFADVFARYLPNNRTTVQPPRKKPRK